MKEIDIIENLPGIELDDIDLSSMDNTIDDIKKEIESLFVHGTRNDDIKLLNRFMLKSDESSIMRIADILNVEPDIYKKELSNLVEYVNEIEKGRIF